MNIRIETKENYRTMFGKAQCDLRKVYRIIFQFPKLKKFLKGSHWDTIDIETTLTRLLKDVPVEDLQGAYNAWKSRCKKCIDADNGEKKANGIS